MVKASWRRTKRARSAAFCGAVDAAAGSFEDLTRWPYPTCVGIGRESLRLGAGQLLERLQHLVLADREQARVGSARVRIAGPPRPQDPVDRAIRRRSPARGRRGSEQHDRRRAERGRQVRDARVAAHDAPRDGDRRGELAHGRAAGQHVRVARSGGGGDPPRAHALVRTARDHDPPAGAALRGDDARPALRRPAARGRRGAGMDDRGAAGARRGLGRGSIDGEVGRIGVDPGGRQQPAPPRDLVLVLVPDRPVVAVACERQQPPRMQVGEHGVALGPAAVQVDGEPRCPRPRRAGHAGTLRTPCRSTTS